MHGLTELKEE
jgi:hypothetical protein